MSYRQFEKLNFVSNCENFRGLKKKEGTIGERFVFFF